MDDGTLTGTLTAEQEAQARRIADVVMAGMRVEAERIGQLLASKENGELFGETEFQLREMLLGDAFGAGSPQSRRRSRRAQKRGDQGSSVSCPHCREAAKFEGYRHTTRHTTLTSLFGQIPFERPDDHCRHCHRGYFPTDEQLGVLSRKTRAAEEVITLAGITEAFETAAHRVLRKLSGLVVSKSTVHRTTRTTQAAGEQLAQRRPA